MDSGIHLPGLGVLLRPSSTHHVVDIFEDGGEAADDKGELVLGDVDQTLLVVLCAHFGVRVLVSDFDGKLVRKEAESKNQLKKSPPSVHASVMKSHHDRRAGRSESSLFHTNTSVP